MTETACDVCGRLAGEDPTTIFVSEDLRNISDKFEVDLCESCAREHIGKLLIVANKPFQPLD